MTEMNTCGACKFFGPTVDDEDGSHVPHGYHRCTLIDFIHHGKDAPKPIAGVVDASGFYAALCVKEDFGCNQFQQAESMPAKAHGHKTGE